MRVDTAPQPPDTALAYDIHRPSYLAYGPYPGAPIPLFVHTAPAHR